MSHPKATPEELSLDKPVAWNFSREHTGENLRGVMKLDALTTEFIRKKFKNNFDLCSFSIHIGRTMIMGGQQATLGQIIEEIDRQAENEGRSLKS